MRFKKFLKLIVLTLSMVLTTVTINPGIQAYAENQNNETRNLIIVSNDIGNFIYTYSEDGKDYKVKEKSTEDRKHVDSEIYVKKEDGNYELEETRIFNITGEYATNRIINAKTMNETTEKININNLISTKDAIQTRASPPDGGGGMENGSIIKPLKHQLKLLNIL